MKRKLISVGCNDYTHLDGLHGAEKDATDIFDTLTNEKYGNYDKDKSRLLLSPTLVELYDVFSDVLFSEPDLDNLCFYFAGHGVVKSSNYYLCLKESSINSLSITALDFSKLLNILSEKLPVQANIIIDACEAGGVTHNMGSIIKPENFGKNNACSMSFFLAAASNENADEDSNGGVITQSLIDVIKGNNELGIASEYYDLCALGKCVSSNGSLLNKTQTPICWGLHLHGESRFSLNPNYKLHEPNGNEASGPPIPNTLQVNEIEKYSEKLWILYLELPKKFSAHDLIILLCELSDDIEKADGDALDVLRGIAASFSLRADLSEDVFRRTEVLCCFLVAMIRCSHNNYKVAIPIINDVFNSASDALEEVFELLKNDKYAFLGRLSGFSDLFYLPLRVARVLGWIGVISFMGKKDFIQNKHDETFLIDLTDKIIDLYQESIVAISDTQSPFYLMFLKECLENGWIDQGELCVGYLFNNINANSGSIASPHIRADEVLTYINCHCCPVSS